jgi:hypothetical protein
MGSNSRLSFGGGFALWVISSRHRQKEDALAVDHDLSGMFEIDRHLVANVGLYLTQTPIRLFRVAHQHARFE